MAEKWFCFKDKAPMVEVEAVLLYLNVTDICQGLKCPQCGVIYLEEGTVVEKVVIAEQMLDIGRFVLIENHPPLGRDLCKPILRHQIPNSMQTTVAADRLAIFAHQLHAVVIHGIMAGGDHDTAI